MRSTTRPLVLLLATIGACASAVQACSSDSGGSTADGGASHDATGGNDVSQGADTGGGSHPDAGAEAEAGGGGGQDSGADTKAPDVVSDAPPDVPPDVPADAPPDVPADVPATDVVEAAPPPDAPLDAPDGGSCTYTLSGATSASGKCNESFVLSAQGLSFVLAAPPGTKPLMSFTAYPGGSAPAAGTYTTANVTCSSGDVTINPPVASPQYLEISGSAPCGGGGALAQGTFTLTITDPGTMVTVDGGSAWYGVHGTLSVSAPGIPGDVNSPGTVTVAATF